MKISRFVATAGIVLALAPGLSAWAGSPARGSAEEAAAFERHAIASDRLVPGRLPPAPPGGELKEELLPSERPSLRFLKNKKGGFTPQGAGQAKPESKLHRLENPLISPPSDFDAEYELGADAEVVITIIGADGAPLHERRIAPGEQGARKGKNSLSLWDGQDRLGREAPAGDYHAIIVSRSGEGAPSATKVIPLRKAAK